jgi:hypothetical protein
MQRSTTARFLLIIQPMKTSIIIRTVMPRGVPGLHAAIAGDLIALA